MGRPTREQQRRKNIGKAVTKFTPEVLSKLEAAFLIDASVVEACFSAGISETTYYRWLKENPDLRERFETLRCDPVFKARQEVVKGIEGDKRFAFDYLKSKRPDEFSGKVKVEHSERVDMSDNPEAKRLAKEFEEIVYKAAGRAGSEE